MIRNKHKTVDYHRLLVEKSSLILEDDVQAVLNYFMSKDEQTHVARLRGVINLVRAFCEVDEHKSRWRTHDKAYSKIMRVLYMRLKRQILELQFVQYHMDNAINCEAPCSVVEFFKDKEKKVLRKISRLMSDWISSGIRTNRKIDDKAREIMASSKTKDVNEVKHND